MSATKLATLLLAVCGAALPCHADLVAHYALDETDGDAAPAADSLGANPGAVIGGAGNVSKGFASPKAYLGSSYDFALRGGLDLGDSTVVRPIDQWTMTWWMRSGGSLRGWLGRRLRVHRSKHWIKMRRGRDCRSCATVAW